MKLNYILCTVALGLLFGSRIGHADEKVAEQLKPLITTSELVVGRNRFAFGLLKANKLLEGADVQLRIYGIEGHEASLVAEINAPYRPLTASSRAKVSIATLMERNTSTQLLQVCEVSTSPSLTCRGPDSGASKF